MLHVNSAVNMGSALLHLHTFSRDTKYGSRSLHDIDQCLNQQLTTFFKTQFRPNETAPEYAAHGPPFGTRGRIHLSVDNPFLPFVL